jgi:hypothetical protein
LEVGSRSPSPGDAEKLDRLFDLVDRRHFFGLYQAIVQGAPTGPIWLLDWVREIEPRAVLLQAWDPLLVTGLLQTETYARTVFAAEPEITSQEVERRVAARMQRRDIFNREHPPTLLALLDEGVLRRRVGTPQVMREQLEFLYELAHWPNVTIQLVGPDALTGASGALMLAELPGAEPDAIQAESQADGRISTDPDVVTAIRRRYDAIRSRAYPKNVSLEMIREETSQWI